MFGKNRRTQEKVVDSIRQGDKIVKITVHGDTSALFNNPKVKEKLTAWNAVLGNRS